MSVSSPVYSRVAQYPHTRAYPVRNSLSSRMSTDQELKDNNDVIKVSDGFDIPRTDYTKVPESVWNKMRDTLGSKYKIEISPILDFYQNGRLVDGMNIDDIGTILSTASAVGADEFIESLDRRLSILLRLHRDKLIHVKSLFAPVEKADVTAAKQLVSNP